MTDNIYYPLKPIRPKRYTPPDVVYLSIETDREGKFLFGSSINLMGALCQYDTIRGVVEFLSSLPSSVWVITHTVDFIGALFVELVNVFVIEGVGEETLNLTLTQGKIKIYIVDTVGFFGDLNELCFKYGLRERFSAKSKYDDVYSYSKMRVEVIKLLWDDLAGEIKKLFKVYPSKSPGATALKTFQTTLNDFLMPRGKRVRAFNQQAINTAALHWKMGHFPQGYLYDINAAYLHIMRTFAYPVSLSFFANQSPPSNRWIATVKVNYLSRSHFSPLQVRFTDGPERPVLHPDRADNTTVTLSYIDEITLRAAGELEIVEWLEGVSWQAGEEVYIFKDWVDILENELLENPQAKPLLKIMSRSLHSKFSQRPGLPLIQIKRTNRQEVKEIEDQGGEIKDFYPLPDGGLACKFLIRLPDKFHPYIKPEWEMLTTAAARMMLYSAVDQDTVYLDTDCLISTRPREDLNIGPRFGQWKAQGNGELHIAGPRLYLLGGETKAAGIAAGNRKNLVSAIRHSISDIQEEIETIENLRLKAPDQQRLFDKLTIRAIKYPYVETWQNKAFITQSPTREEELITPSRFMSVLKGTEFQTLTNLQKYDNIEGKGDLQGS